MGSREELDFAALRRRLDRAEAESSADAGDAPERRRSILSARARAIAAAKEAPDGGTVPVFAFELGGDRFALAPDEVVQVLDTTELSSIPGSPRWLLGALAARTRIVAVLDPRPLLGLPREGLSDLTHVLVVEHRGEAVGIAVESVLGELRVREEGITRAAVGPLRWSAADGLTGIDVERLLARTREA
jgi:purine-binding chemotaxis protein CheW